MKSNHDDSMQDAQQFIDALRKNDIAGFLKFKEYLDNKYFNNNHYKKDKDYSAIFNWEFLKTNVDLQDLKTLINFELHFEGKDDQASNAMTALIKEARRNLFTIVAYSGKEFPEFEQYTHLTSRLPERNELDALAKLCDNNRQKVSDSIDLLKLSKELKGLFIKGQDKLGKIIIDNQFDQYKKGKEFSRFEEKINENMKAPKGSNSMFGGKPKLDGKPQLSSSSLLSPLLDVKNRPRR